MGAVLALLSAVALGVGGASATQTLHDESVAAQDIQEPIVSVQEIQSDTNTSELGW